MKFEEIGIARDKKMLFDIKAKEYLDNLGPGYTHTDMAEAIARAIKEIYGEDTGDLTYELDEDS